MGKNKTPDDPQAELAKCFGSFADDLPLVGDIIERERYLTSYDTSTPEGRLSLFLAVDGDRYDPESVLGKELHVVHCTMFPLGATIGKKKFPIVRAWTVFETDDGRRIGLHSEAVRRELLRVIRTGEIPPWEPPLEVRLVRVHGVYAEPRYRLHPASRKRPRGA